MMNAKHSLSALFALDRLFFLMSIACFGTISLVSSAFAAELIWQNPVNNCTTLNCGAVFLNGISYRDTNGDSIPFTTEVFADANECLRLDVFGESADMQTVLVSPSGSIWKNDDRAPSDRRPLVTARTDVKGYYTVQINYYQGLQPVNSLQLLNVAYGRYVPGTPTNCLILP